MMNHQEELFRQEREREQEKKRQERQKKRDERSKSFWSTFLFTENGKPKSGFIVYTFCLSVVFIALHILAYNVIDLLQPLTARWPVFWGNLFGSLCFTAPVLLIGTVLHRLFSDKRLMFGTYIWLLLYLVAALITLSVYMHDTDDLLDFILYLALWFAIIPVVLGDVLFFFLCRRDHHPKPSTEEEPEWKKYVHRR